MEQPTFGAGQHAPHRLHVSAAEALGVGEALT
jgi:hypothetical protein